MVMIMKYLKTFLFSFLICVIIATLFPAEIKASNDIIETSSYGNALFEASTRTFITGKNQHEKLYPASMTKMMGLLLVLEDIEKGKYDFNSLATTSKFASSMGGSQIFLEVGEEMSIEDLFKSVAINSANDAITVLAENSEGSVPNFVKRMNEKAKTLGMKNTHFVNPTGFFDQDHYSSAYDMGLLGLELVNKYPDIILKYTSQYESYIREDSDNPFWLVTTNKMMKTYSGMDGLKTGYITQSGYCLTATAIKNNVRMVSVVMKATSIEERSKDTKTLLDYGFSLYKNSSLFEKENIISTYNFKNAKTKNTPLKVNETVNFVHPLDKDISSYNYKIVMNKTKAPLKKDEKVGSLNVYDKDNNLIKSYPVYVAKDVDEKNFWYKFMYNLKQILF